MRRADGYPPWSPRRFHDGALGDPEGSSRATYQGAQCREIFNGYVARAPSVVISSEDFPGLMCTLSRKAD